MTLKLFSNNPRWTAWLEKYHETVSRYKTSKLVENSTIFRGFSHDEDWDPSDSEIQMVFGELHPVFVWWHTFAHHLIRAIQQESGYSSAAIQERVYAYPVRDVQTQQETWKGGIVLHVTQPGMDGTLGGLISLCSSFQEFLNRVKESMERCSNDPLCSDTPSGSFPSVGCYACTFNSETSCEHRNFFQDRLLLSQSTKAP